MARLSLRGLTRTLVVRLIGILAFTGALGIGLSWLLEMAVSEPEWTETAAVAQRAVDRSGLPELLAGQNARSPSAGPRRARASSGSCRVSSTSRSGTRRAPSYGRCSPD